jgi:hypothetical protein
MSFKVTVLSSVFFMGSLLSLSQAQAVYQPGQQARPHTVCVQGGDVDAGLQVLITSPNNKSLLSKVEVLQKQEQKFVAIASRNSVISNSRSAAVYSANGLELSISTVERNELGQRLGHVILTLQDGAVLEADLDCQALLYPMASVSAKL